MRASVSLVLVLVGASAGLGFSAISTYDSLVHLDRQVHGVHCSYLLGLGATDVSGSTGCYATLMSPYSSLWRRAIWGGIPIALPSMSVFGFIAFWALWSLLTRRRDDRRAAGFLWAATALPVLGSAVMGYLSFVTLGAACKLCIGIYISSALSCIAAGVVYLSTRRQHAKERAESPLAWGSLLAAFGGGVLFVALPCLTFAAVAPDFSHYAGNCGSLRDPRHNPEVMIPVGPQSGTIEIVEVLDPLCGACQVLERRFTAMSESRQVRRKLVLFPLDSACNWMVNESVHPGACAASEAVLCASGDRVNEVLGWIFQSREELLRAARQDPQSPRRLLERRFPTLHGCLGQPAVRARLNQVLRWIVKNRLQVLTPQVYVSGERLCDEDTDLGLEYAITRLIARARAHTASGDGSSQDRPPAAESTPAEPRRPRPARPEPRPLDERGRPDAAGSTGATAPDGSPTAPDASGPAAAPAPPGNPPLPPPQQKPAPPEPPAPPEQPAPREQPAPEQPAPKEAP